jgi:hypothetical protein
VNHYQPFIEDPAHLGELDRQRFVVLRMPPGGIETYAQIQTAVRRRLTAAAEVVAIDAGREYSGGGIPLEGVE